MKRNRFTAIGTAILLLCTGCGAGEEVDNLKAGMEAIKNLEYNEAVSCFKTALSDNEDERQESRR